MEKLMNKEVQDQIKTILDGMINPIHIVLFTKNDQNNSSETTKQLLEELKELTEKINFESYVLSENLELAKQYDINDAPSFVVLDQNKNDLGVKFSGVPLGHEINSLLSAIMEVSGVDFGFDDELINQIKAIDKPVNIKVFVTMSCPHCPGAVQNAHRLAMLNPNIKAEMIEAQTYYDLSMKYNVSGVPKIIINETQELLGNQPIQAFLNEINKI